MLSGWLVLVRGVVVCKQHKRLWIPVLIPVLLNFLIFIALFYVGGHYITPWFFDFLQSMVGELPVFVKYLVMGLFIYIFYLFAVFFFSSFGLMIGGFFYTVLASRVVEVLMAESGHRLTVTVAPFWAIMWYEFRKFLVLVCGGIIVTTLSWLVPVLSWLFLACLVAFVAYEYFDYGFEALHMSYGERWRWVRTRIWSFFSAGLVVYLILSIPLFGFMLCPFCVVGSTELLLTKQLQRPPPTPSEPTAPSVTA